MAVGEVSGTAARRVYTVGHSSRSIEELIGLLSAAGVARLVDVRAHPVSRRHPQFAKAALEQGLAAAGIDYRWLGHALGGMRRPRPGSPHRALLEAAFRGYADHMASGAFRTAMAHAMDAGGSTATALLCAERLPEHCHRSLIADFLVARGIEVVHLIEPEVWRSHRLRPEARLAGDRLIYDWGVQEALDLG
jgi:uncharacterized protein (DUF488 family)